MYKLIVLCAFLAIATAAPKAKPDLVYTTYTSPQVVSSVVSPAVTSYSSYSNAVVHGSPVVSVPLVRTANIVPVVHQTSFVHTPVVHHTPVVQTLPYTYPEQVFVV